MMRQWNISRLIPLLAAVLVPVGLVLLARAWLMDERAPNREEIAFSRISGWGDDDHSAALAAFHRSCERIVSVAEKRAAKGNAEGGRSLLMQACRAALALGPEADRKAAQEFFEGHFTPHRIPGEALSGFVTGYYEPELSGSRSRSERFHVPVHAVPDDLVQLFPDSERAKRNHEMTAGRKTDDGVVPYFDRKEIEQGALDGRGLEILYLEDWADAFYMHIQGSGRVALEEGGHVRLGFAAKNGHSYTAIGRTLIERGAIPSDEISMDSVRAWLEANGEGARELMWQNRSYIFFRELPTAQAAIGPVGAQGVALSERRSLAVDTSIHPLGLPIWVDVPDMDMHGEAGFSHLMIAQDAGSAIKGEQRGDIFWGSGKAAGDIAGATRHRAEFILLLPKGDSPGS